MKRICSNKATFGCLSKISTDVLAQELITRDKVKELLYAYSDHVIISGCDGESKLSYETNGPVQILILKNVLV